MHEVLVNRLGGLSLPRKSVVRLTGRPDMTLDVYRGRKTTIQYNTILCDGQGAVGSYPVPVTGLVLLYACQRRVILCCALRLSVCPLTFRVRSITDTVPDIFMKLGANINHHQTMCREQELTLHLHFYGIMAL